MGKYYFDESFDSMLLWLYPCTITRTRYGGAEENSSWVAFPLNPDELPDDWDADEVTCGEFWKNYKEPVGHGGTPEDAYYDLIRQIEDE